MLFRIIAIFAMICTASAAASQEACGFNDLRFEAPACFAHDSGSKPNKACTVSYTAPEGYIIIDSDEKLWENLHGRMEAPNYTSVADLRAEAEVSPENQDLLRRVAALEDVRGFNTRSFSVSVTMRATCSQECIGSHCNCRVGAAIPLIAMPAKCLRADVIQID